MIVNFFKGRLMVSRRHALAENDVDPEVFHHRVDEFFDGGGEPMNFIDEEDGPFSGVGQERQHVLLFVERGPAGDIELDPQLVVQDGGEGGLAEAGGTVEEDMGEGLAALLGRDQADRESLGDRALTDHSQVAGA